MPWSETKRPWSPSQRTVRGGPQMHPLPDRAQPEPGTELRQRRDLNRLLQPRVFGPCGDEEGHLSPIIRQLRCPRVPQPIQRDDVATHTVLGRLVEAGWWMHLGSRSVGRIRSAHASIQAFGQLAGYVRQAGVTRSTRAAGEAVRPQARPSDAHGGDRALPDRRGTSRAPPRSPGEYGGVGAPAAAIARRSLPGA